MVLVSPLIIEQINSEVVNKTFIIFFMLTFDYNRTCMSKKIFMWPDIRIIISRHEHYKASNWNLKLKCFNIDIFFLGKNCIHFRISLFHHLIKNWDKAGSWSLAWIKPCRFYIFTSLWAADLTLSLDTDAISLQGFKHVSQFPSWVLYPL